MLRELLFCGMGLLVVLGTAKGVLAESKVEKPPSKISLLPPDAGAWVIEIDTRGGFTGLGVGSVRITSQGDVEITRIPTLPKCRTLVPTAALRQLEEVISSANPSRWANSYPDEVPSPPIRSSLILRRRGQDGSEQTYRTSGGSVGAPEDLRAVQTAAWEIWNKVRNSCLVRQALKEIAGGRGDFTPLVVTYDDLHGLHGGLRLTIHGTGKVEQEAKREPVGVVRAVSREELIKLAALLVKHAAWEQHVAERMSVPDESRASLTVAYGSNSVQIWEWYNDLKHNGRIGDIAAFMKRIAITQPQSLHGEGVGPTIHAATCRDSRLPPKADWPFDADGGRHLRFDVDVDGDGQTDVLDATHSSGSGFSSTSVELTFGGTGTRLRAEEAFAFTAMTAVNPMPKELLASRHGGALAWIEEALFSRVCRSPDPSLAWLLDPAKRLTWIDGPPEMPAFYAIRLPARRLMRVALGAYQEAGAAIDPAGKVWLTYAGHVHTHLIQYADRPWPVELARKGERVLLGTAHGVILTNPRRSRHAWIYVTDRADKKLRWPSIVGARLQGETAIITLNRSRLDPDNSSPEGKNPETLQVRVNLNTGAISK